MCITARQLRKLSFSDISDAMPNSCVALIRCTMTRATVIQLLIFTADNRRVYVQS